MEGRNGEESRGGGVGHRSGVAPAGSGPVAVQRGTSRSWSNRGGRAADRWAAARVPGGGAD
jgi:hypothetical protein